MKTLPPALASHITQEVTTLATCIRIERRDGEVLGLTDHDRDLTIDSVVYHTVPGFSPTKAAATANFAVDNIDYRALLDSDKLDSQELLWGAYDYARVIFLLVNWADPGSGTLVLMDATLGEVSLEDSFFTAELRSLTQHLTARIGRTVMLECDVPVFGEDRCGLDKANYTDRVSVTSVVDQYNKVDTNTGQATNYYQFGEAVFVTGENAGHKVLIAKHVGTELTFFGRTPSEINPGDDLDVIAGCDRQFLTCTNKFFNSVNFQGFPHVPGRDKAYQQPRAK